MKSCIPLVLLLALAAAPGAWGDEPPAQDVAPTSPAASPPSEELPYGAGYEARQRQAAERERNPKAAEAQRPAATTRETAAGARASRPERPVPRETTRPSDTRPARPERRP